jgi:hypothetical protein
MKLKHLLLSALIATGASGAAHASLVLTPLTSADYITVGALDWAWAAPIRSQFFNSNVLSQASLHEGWREATDLEWATRPTAGAFGGKCAAQYWNTIYTHCDFSDTVAQHWVAGSGNPADLWYVRSQEAVGSVPEPTAPALIGVALLGLLAARRNKNKAS